MQTKKIIGIALAAALVGSMAAVAATSVSAVDSVDADFSLEGHSVGIIGGFNSWGSDIAEMTDADGDGVYVGVVNNVAAGDTEFKIRLDGAWDYSWGDYEADYDRTFNSQTNCKISTTEATDLIVLLDTNGADANIWAVKYFTVENEGGDTTPQFSTLGVIGGFNDWGGDVAMTNNGGIYSAAIGDLAAGTEFKVRADGAWDLSWGAYEADYERTQNSQTNCKVTEDAKNVQVFLDTNGSDYEIWTLAFAYTNAEGEIVVVDTGINGQTEEESSKESSEESSKESSEESSKESSEESSKESSEESSKEESKTGPRDSTIKDYVFFDNSKTKWEKVYAYWWHSDYAKTTDYKGDLWGCVEKTNEDGTKGYEPVGFPGTEMTQITGTDIWQVKVPFGAQYLIFSSGKTDDQIKAGETGYQTSDLKFNDVEDAGQIYTVDASVEPKAGRGVEKTKFKYEVGAWSAYTGEFIQEKIEKEVSHESTPDASSKNDTSSKAGTTTTTTTTTSTTGTTVDAPQTGSVAMAVAFVTIATAALGAVVLAAKKKRDEE